MVAAQNRVLLGTAGEVGHGKTSLVAALARGGAPADEPEDATAIDLGFTTHEIAGRSVGVVDLPAGSNGLSQSLARLAAVDVVLCVVAAEVGATPATGEQIDALINLHGQPIVFAVSRADRVDAGQAARVVAQLREMTAGTVAAAIDPVVTSAHDGRGIETLGQTLAALLATPRPRRASGRFRMPIARGFILAGRGPIALGTALAGQIREGTELALASGRRSRVGSVLAQGRSAREGRAGQRLALTLPDLGPGDLIRGLWLTEPGFGAGAERLDALIRVSRWAQRSLREFTAIRFHLGGSQTRGQLQLLGSAPELAAGETGFCQIALERPIVACTDDRFVFVGEHGDRLLGCGEILHPGAARHPATDATMARLQRLRESSGAARTAPLLELRRFPVAPLALVAQALDLPPAAITAQVRRDPELVALPAATDALALTTASLWRELSAEVSAVAASWFAAHPDAPGIETETLRARLPSAVPPELFASAVPRLMAEGVLIALEDGLLGIPASEEGAAAPERSVGLARARQRSSTAAVQVETRVRPGTARRRRVGEGAAARPFEAGVLREDSAEHRTRPSPPEHGRHAPGPDISPHRERADERAPARPRPPRAVPARSEGGPRNGEAGLAALAGKLAAAGMAPPGVTLLGVEFRAPRDEILRLLKLLEQRDQAVAVATDLFFAPSALEQARACILDCFERSPTLSAAGLRDRIGASRRHALALLDDFDRQGLTVRSGDVRLRA